MRASRSEQGVEVAITAEHADDFDAFVGRTVEDEIAPDKEAAQAGVEFVACPAESRVFRKEAVFINNGGSEAIGSFGVALRDVGPDLAEVCLGSVGDFELPHPALVARRSASC